MRYSKFIIITIFLLIIGEIARWSHSSMGTSIMMIFNYLSIIILLYLPINSKKSVIESINVFYFLWLVWSCFNMIRGVFLAADYWDWKVIMFDAIGFTFISLTFFIGLNLQLTLKLFHQLFYVVFPICFLTIPLGITSITSSQLYPRLMMPISFFLVFIPFLSKQWLKIMIFLIIISSILIGWELRSNIIKILFSIIILFLFYFRKIITTRIFLIIQFLIFALPIIFLFLAFTINWNIFQKMTESNDIVIRDSSGQTQSLTADTRTFLYVEVINSVMKSGNILIGESSIGKYESIFFDPLGDGRGRYSSEVGILNIFLYHGLVGVVLYFLLLFTISYSALKNGNNFLVKALGLLIASRWFLSFIEEFTMFDMNFYFFWLFLGLCSNKFFQKMNNDEIKFYFHQI